MGFLFMVLATLILHVYGKEFFIYTFEMFNFISHALHLTCSPALQLHTINQLCGTESLKNYWSPM